MLLKSLRYLFLLFAFFLMQKNALAQKKYRTISGFVREEGSKENIVGASVIIVESQQITQTNNYGFFSLNTDLDSITLWVSMVGYGRQFIKMKLTKDESIQVFISSNNTLAEVVVQDNRNLRLAEEQQMSINRITPEQVKSLPSLMGEKDVLKVLQLLPGIQKGSEGNSGLYVRGGGPDQNLIILDDAPVYNAFHLFGFYSLFNGDALKNIELTKGGFPARYGGRLSSVLDMTMKDGNKEEVKGEFGIGAISSRGTIEGPIKKGKSSYLLSGRRTYIDLLIQPFLPEESKGGYYFYDLNAKVNVELDPKNKLYLSGYFGRDKFYGKEQYDENTSNFGLRWGNATGTVRWNHLISPKIFSNTSFIYSTYNLNIFSEEKFDGDLFELKLSSGIRDFSLKQDFDFAIGNKHSVKVGAIVSQHRFTPSATTIKNDAFPDENIDEKEIVDAIESAAYIEDMIQHNIRWKSNVGLRLSQFYQNSKNYYGLEPRFGTSYQLFDDFAVKASYAVMTQYIHLLSSTGVGLPTDLWVPSTQTVKPQRSSQFALGIAKDFIPQKISVTIEGYHKTMRQILAYKEGATFLGIDEPGDGEKITWEENVTSGKGLSYGMEFFVKRTDEKWEGWVGYTLSWTTLQFDELNNGKEFYARYDRRHDISVVGIFHPSKNMLVSATWVYGTGNAITLPKAEYLAQYPNPGTGSTGSLYVTDYGEKNAFRMEAYHRLDVSLQFQKQLKRALRTFEISVYNVYNRKNPYFYYIGVNSAGNSSLRKISLFPILPSLSWTYKF